MQKPIKRLLAVAALVSVSVGGSGTPSTVRGRLEAAPTLPITAPVTRGAIVDASSSTGTLQAVTTVQVGTQVSGTIQSLGADFNSIVKRGQVLARLDPSLFQAQVDAGPRQPRPRPSRRGASEVALQDANTSYAGPGAVGASDCSRRASSMPRLWTLVRQRPRCARPSRRRSRRRGRAEQARSTWRTPSSPRRSTAS